MTARRDRRSIRGVRVKTGLAIGMLAALVGGCAHNPCVGPASARPTMPCTCPGSTDPSCYPFPADAKKPKPKEIR